VKRRLLLLSLLLAAGLHLRPAAIEWKQQCSAWFSLNDDKPSTPRFGVRWQPAFSLAKSMARQWKIDCEFSLDASASGSAPAWIDAQISGAVKPYRLWLRLSSERFEARLGLQKINFGSATVFRPLMWFDRIDVRDPLQITTGVWGLLLRYYFKGNANLWVWGLYGNGDPKGWETLPTADRAPEFGSRFQAPLFSGEAAASAHFRRVPKAGLDPAAGRSTESRFALDGKWDIGVGLWIEAAFVHLSDPAAMLPWQRSLAAGVDYTFGLGNGLYLLAEQYLCAAATTFAGVGSGGAFSAVLARYPLGLLDNLSAVVYFDWRNRRLYSFAGWQRTLDRWQFHLMAFWNPRTAPELQVPSGSNAFAGGGFQLLAVWNI
jgi:hypothetical protein